MYYKSWPICGPKPVYRQRDRIVPSSFNLLYGISCTISCFLLGLFDIYWSLDTRNPHLGLRIYLTLLDFTSTTVTLPSKPIGLNLPNLLVMCSQLNLWTQSMSSMLYLQHVWMKNLWKLIVGKYQSFSLVGIVTVQRQPERVLFWTFSIQCMNSTGLDIVWHSDGFIVTTSNPWTAENIIVLGHGQQSDMRRVQLQWLSPSALCLLW